MMADFNVHRKNKEDEDDDFEDVMLCEGSKEYSAGDESISERIVGLTEMFPEGVRNTFSSTFGFLYSATKGGCWLVRNVLWLASSSAVILVLPVIFESERAQQHEEQLQQQRQILLGPNAAVSSGGSSNLLPGMGMVPPPPMAQRPQ